MLLLLLLLLLNYFTYLQSKSCPLLGTPSPSTSCCPPFPQPLRWCSPTWLPTPTSPSPESLFQVSTGLIASSLTEAIQGSPAGKTYPTDTTAFGIVPTPVVGAPTWRTSLHICYICAKGRGSKTSPCSFFSWWYNLWESLKVQVSWPCWSHLSFLYSIPSSYQNPEAKTTSSFFFSLCMHIPSVKLLANTACYQEEIERPIRQLIRFANGLLIGTIGFWKHKDECPAFLYSHSQSLKTTVSILDQLKWEYYTRKGKIFNMEYSTCWKIFLVW